MPAMPLTIDALDRPHPQASIGTRWALVSDRVMGGVSSGTMARETVAGRPALRMRGGVSLENDGGFLQIALDLATGGGTLDARAWTGLALDVLGNGVRYNLHLRTADVRRPWQSYRAGFTATPDWRTVYLPFDGFAPHRLDAPLDLGRLRRLGIVAIGRAFDADIAVGGLRFESR
ncbi:MAG: CIA30 family protein [Roseicyclus sp.]